MSALTEKNIVEAVRRGRREGQTEMVGRYAQRIFAMIVRQVSDVMDAQELTQDTFVRAFDHIDIYDPQRASLSTWLCRIAYRLTLDFLKRRRPLTVSIEDSEVWQTDISDKELEAELSTGREERIEQLMQMVDDLPADERMLVTLYYYEDRPLTEIAYIMGVEAGVLANRLYRTRKKLYKKLCPTLPDVGIVNEEYMNKQYKDTDLREALRRKYADTPQLPPGFMDDMKGQMNAPMVRPVRRWWWVTAAACVLLIIGIGITMMPIGETMPTASNVVAKVESQQASVVAATSKEPKKEGTSSQKTVNKKTDKKQPAKKQKKQLHDSGKQQKTVPVSPTVSPAYTDHLHYASS